jgi:hypothetical protein
MHLLMKIHRQQPEIVANPGAQRDAGMAVGNFSRRDPDLPAIFESREIEARSRVEQHGADALGIALYRGEIERDLQIVGLRHGGIRAGSRGSGKCDHAGNS